MSCPVRRVCVVGSGPCGLSVAKCCLEAGLQVSVLEQGEGVGGLWRYRDEDEEGRPSVMKSTVINTSKEMSAFSDFPPHPEAPNFMHHSAMWRYFHTYADTFKVLPHVTLNTQVTQVRTYMWCIQKFTFSYFLLLRDINVVFFHTLNIHFVIAC